MSIIKTTCPSLDELSKVIGPIDGTDSSKSTPPLCENIFDVQRNELFDVLERLRIAFWSDEVITSPHETTLPNSTAIVDEQKIIEEEMEEISSPTIQPLKRARSEANEDSIYSSDSDSSMLTSSKKRARLSSIKQDESPKLTEEKISKQKTPPVSSTSSLQSHVSLWPLKLSLLRQIKTSRYNESDIVTTLTDLCETKPKDQCYHVVVYLIPLAKAMRRESLVQFLNEKLSSL
ncbi:MAG: hypothetical protein EXX96DRAFT_546549 [Benjaminiella poitrasii]|nr:MAG: hypothetical protein EXX96DRAFT_546549 [Benjaminiella poitrasii]